jgi:hypothetical protein
MNFIKGVLYQVPSGEPVEIPLRNLAVFGVTRDSGKTTFIESAVDASKLKAITFRTKRGEIGFEGAHQLPIFFDERGLTHWKAFEGLMSATLEEKVQREPGIRGAIIRVCMRPKQAETLEEVHERVKAHMKEKMGGFERDVFDKLDAYLNEVLPQIKQLRPRFTDKLDLQESGVYVEDLVGISDEVQCLLIASVMRKCYEEGSGIIVVFPEAWKFLPQDRGSPVKWVIEKYVREMGAVESYLWMDTQDLRGVDKKHLRSIDTRLFGRQPDPHEIEELLKALPLPRGAKPSPEQIMTLKLGHFYAKLRDNVELVYVRPRWLPEDVAIQVAKGLLAPDGKEVERYKPRAPVHTSIHTSVVTNEANSQVLEVNDEVYKEMYEKEKAAREEETHKREELEKEFARQVERISDQKADVKLNDFVKRFKEEFAKEMTDAQNTIAELTSQLQTFNELKQALAKVFPAPAVGVVTPNGVPGEVSVQVQPTLTEFTVKTAKREVLEATDQDPLGQILLLAHSGWFGEHRKITAVRTELERRFNSHPRPASLENILPDLVEKKILTREKEGNSWSYWLVDGAEKLIKAAEAQ